MALVRIVLLGNVRGALLVLAVLPLATLGAAIPLHFAGLGLNAMTLGGLAISVGLLVDAAVIMVENLAPVSYTHLDVYKRQAQPTAAPGNTVSRI